STRQQSGYAASTESGSRQPDPALLTTTGRRQLRDNLGRTSRSGSAAQDRADAAGGFGDRGVPGGGGLLDGERPVRRAEPQRVRQRFASLTGLRARVDVEQPDFLQQVRLATAAHPRDPGRP